MGPPRARHGHAPSPPNSPLAGRSMLVQFFALFGHLSNKRYAIETALALIAAYALRLWSNGLVRQRSDRNMHGRVVVVTVSI